MAPKKDEQSRKRTLSDVKEEENEAKVNALISEEPDFDDCSSTAALPETVMIPSVGAQVEMKVNPKRVRHLNTPRAVPPGSKCIIYWMSRDQRVQDNWALLYAQQLSIENKLPLRVCFCLVPRFMDATIRQFGFMLDGLKEVDEELRGLGIPFHLLIGFAKDLIGPFVEEQKAGAVVSDFSPLRVPLSWISDVSIILNQKNVPYYQVDAHNIVPCWHASDKLEYAARTIRPRITRQLAEFLTGFPVVQKQTIDVGNMPPTIDWEKAKSSLEVDRTVKEVHWARPGARGGLQNLTDFLERRLKNYHDKRNDPTLNTTSNVSPWLHFGQISAQRCALQAKTYASRHSASVAGFLEELIIRRELADNFCFYNANYDKIEGAANWAKETLKLHAKDKRDYIYTQEQLENGKTHDDLWNAAQLQMVREGKMHGFLRMYWAKKILEWTPSPEEALRVSIYLNDRYELDGRDPNGFVGCMWSICGIHDQGWRERPVFGKIRYMNYQGCKGKFDVAAFVRKYPGSQPTTALSKIIKKEPKS